jgi:hypothetical protein
MNAKERAPPDLRQEHPSLPATTTAEAIAGERNEQTSPPTLYSRENDLLHPVSTAGAIAAHYDARVEDLLTGVLTGDVFVDPVSAVSYLQARRDAAQPAVRPSTVPTEVPILDPEQSRRERQNAKAREGMRRLRKERRVPRPDRAPQPDELTPAEAAQRAGWTTAYVRQILAYREPGFEAEQRAGRWFIKRASFENFLAQHRGRARSR